MRQQQRPVRSAYRDGGRRRVHVGETPADGGETIHVRRWYPSVGIVTSDVAEAYIVCQNDNDVWPVRLHIGDTALFIVNKRIIGVFRYGAAAATGRLPSHPSHPLAPSNEAEASAATPTDTRLGDAVSRTIPHFQDYFRAVEYDYTVLQDPVLQIPDAHSPRVFPAFRRRGSPGGLSPSHYGTLAADRRSDELQTVAAVSPFHADGV